MKQTITSILAVIITALSVQSYGQTTSEPLPATEPRQATTLIINADVTVVLVNNDKATLKITGRKSLPQMITFKRSGDTLVIGSVKPRVLKGAGVIYVPASRLQTLRINSGAHVSSLYALQAPQLDVIVNGACTFNIINIGKLNVIGTDDYAVDQHTEIHQLPAGIIRE